MKDWEEIIAKLFYWKVKDEHNDKAFANFVAHVARDQHTPFFDPSFTTAFLDGIELALGREIAEWLSYLVYEVKLGEKWPVTTGNGIEYDFGAQGEAIRFFQEQYPLNTHTK